MERILHVNACPNKRGVSRTLRIADAFIEEYKKINNCEIVEIELFSENISFCTAEDIEKRNLLISENDFNDEMFDFAKEFASADKIIISAPYWDLSFPAVLKNYIEKICVCGITFEYTENGAKGLANADKMLYITSAGGYVEKNLGALYLEEIGKFFGIGEFKEIISSELDIQGKDVEKLVNNTIKNAKKYTNIF